MPLIYFILSKALLSLVFELEDETAWICSIIIACTAWIVETIKRSNPEYRPINKE